MFCHVLFLLLLAICSNHGVFTYESYFNYAGDEHVINDFSDANCRNITNKKQFYVPKVNCSGDCDSMFERVICASDSLENETYFPKCCPPDFEYEGNDHKCVKTDTNLTIIHELIYAVTLIKSGLENCKVVADYPIKYSDFSAGINRDGSVKYRNKIYRQGDYCLDKIVDSEDIILRVCESIDICKRHGNDDGIRCVKKCCPDGQIFNNSCSPSAGFGVPIKTMSARFRNVNETFAILRSETCRRYAAKEEIRLSIESNGSILVAEVEMLKEYRLEETYYCMEYVAIFKGYKIMLCTIPDMLPKFNYTRIASSLSCVCLVLTIMGYLFLEELESLIGKIIISYCIPFLVLLVELTLQQFRIYPEFEIACANIGFLLLFCVIAWFTWMTIMSYDIWCVLGSMSTHYMNQKYKERKKFIWYSIIGWIVPTVWTGCAIINYQFGILPEYLRPIFGRNKCMLENIPYANNYGYHLFLVLPIATMIIFNLIIYSKTICYVLKVKNEIARMKNLDGDEKNRQAKIFNADREKIAMILKIFLVMGVNWIFEVVSSIVYFPQNRYLEVIEGIFDTFNTLQGVIIFCIFMMKRKVFRAVAKKFGIGDRLRKHSAVTLTSEVTMKSNPGSFVRNFRN